MSEVRAERPTHCVLVILWVALPPQQQVYRSNPRVRWATVRDASAVVAPDAAKRGSSRDDQAVTMVQQGLPEGP